MFPTCQLGICVFVGRAVTHAAVPWPVTAGARFQCQSSPCEICGGQSGTGAGFSTSTSFVSCLYHSTDALRSFVHLSPTLYNFSKVKFLQTDSNVKFLATDSNVKF